MVIRYYELYQKKQKSFGRARWVKLKHIHTVIDLHIR